MNEIAITKDLRAAGFSQEQSETLTRNIKTLSREAVNRDYVESLVRDVIRDGEVATREDIAKLDSKLTSWIPKWILRWISWILKSVSYSIS